VITKHAKRCALVTAAALFGGNTFAQTSEREIKLGGVTDLIIRFGPIFIEILSFLVISPNYVLFLTPGVIESFQDQGCNPQKNSLLAKK
jgi:hypothetical protein